MRPAPSTTSASDSACYSTAASVRDHGRSRQGEEEAAQWNLALQHKLSTVPTVPKVLTVGGRWVPLMHACKSINDPACPGQSARRPAGLPSDAPPRIEVGQQRDRSPLPPKPSAQSRMFITALRSSRKRVAFFTGLVKKSAGFSSVETYGTSSSKFSTMSRTKKCRRSTCFIRS